MDSVVEDVAVCFPVPISMATAAAVVLEAPTEEVSAVGQATDGSHSRRSPLRLNPRSQGQSGGAGLAASSGGASSGGGAPGSGAVGGGGRGGGRKGKRQRSQRRAEEEGADDESRPDVEDYSRQLVNALRAGGRAQRQLAQWRLLNDRRRLGRCRRGVLGGLQSRVGDNSDTTMVSWEGGSEADQLEALRADLAEQKQRVEQMTRTWKALQRPKTSSSVAAQQLGTASGALGSSHAAVGAEEVARSHEEVEEEIWEQKELCSAKLLALQRLEQDIKERDQRLQADRADHLRRARAEEMETQGRFNEFETLGKRYLLLQPLGHAAYRAYDLQMLRSCLLHLHPLSFEPSMRLADREALLRELEVETRSLLQLRHHSLPVLLDCMPLENLSLFVTTWEYCEGETLEAVLEKGGPLPEKDARGIFIQIVSALRHLELHASSGQLCGSASFQLSPEDARPNRIVLRAGNAHLTTTVALPGRLRQSQGGRGGGVGCGAGGGATADGSAGEVARHRSVDSLDGFAASDVVTALGETLYDMLFGRRPSDPTPHSGSSLGVAGLAGAVSPVLSCTSSAPMFGSSGSGVLGASRSFQLPEFPKVSPECRDFLARLLDQNKRLTLQEAYNDSFIQPSKKQR